MSDVHLHDPLGAAAETCPTGYLWYTCATNNFEGCCSHDPCGLEVACPVDNQPVSTKTSLPDITPTAIPTASIISSAVVSPSAALSSETTSASPLLGGARSTETASYASSAPIASITTSTATVITATTLPSSSSLLLSTKSAAVTIPPPDVVTVVIISPSSSDSVSISTPTVTPWVPSSSPTQSLAAATANAAAHNNANHFPTSMIIGLAAGIVVLVVTMTVIICVLWRNRKIKIVGEDEAVEMRSGRFALIRPYYLAQPKPIPQPSPQLQKPAETASSSTTPIRTRFPGSSFPEVMTPFRDRYPSANSLRRAEQTGADQPNVPEFSSISQQSSREPFASRGASDANIPWTPSSSSRAQSIRSVLYSPPRPTNPQGRPRPASPESSGAATTRIHLSQRWSSNSSNSAGASTVRYSVNSDNVSPVSIHDVYDSNCTVSPLSARTAQRDSEDESLASPRPDFAEFDDSQRMHYHDLTPPPRRCQRSEGSEGQWVAGDQFGRIMGLRSYVLGQGVAEETGEGAAAASYTVAEDASDSIEDTIATDDTTTAKEESSTATPKGV